MKADLDEARTPRLAEAAHSTGRLNQKATLEGTRRRNPAEEHARTFASDLIARTPSWEIFNAAAVIDQHPELKDCQSAVVDLAYEEFCRRIDAGESVDPADFARRFPYAEQSLLRLFAVHDYVDQHPDAFLSEFAAEWPQAGDEIAGFQLVSELGRGAFSRVFLAREPNLGDRPVVVKVCRLTSQSSDEAARLGQLSHPNVVPVYSVQSRPEAGLTIICMPFHGTATLLDVVETAFAKDGPPRRGDVILDVAQRAAKPAAADQDAEQSQPHWTLRRGSYVQAVREIASELCGALAFTHDKGITHGDIKPSNVLLTLQGRAQLIDFNLSRQQDHGGAAVGGTLPYMAPEQLQFLIEGDETGEPVADARSDVYSMGVMLYQLLTGRLPFPPDVDEESRQEAAEKLQQLQRSKTDLVSELKKVVDGSTARLIASCMEFEPRRRPEAKELAEQLRPVPSQTAIKRRKITVAIGALLFFLAASAGVAAGLKDKGERDLLKGWDMLLEAREQRPGSEKREAMLERAHLRFLAAHRQLALRDTNGAAAASVAVCETELGHYPAAADYYGFAAEHGFREASVVNNWAVCLTKQPNGMERAVQLLQEELVLDEQRRPHEAKHKWLLQYNLARYSHLLAHQLEDPQLLQVAIEAIETVRRQRPELKLAKRLESDEQLTDKTLARGNAYVELDRACIFVTAMALLPEHREQYKEKAIESAKLALLLGLPDRDLALAVQDYSCLPSQRDPRSQDSAELAIDTDTLELPDGQSRLGGPLQDRPEMMDLYYDVCAELGSDPQQAE